MTPREYSTDGPPLRLVEYLARCENSHTFRRRSILINAANEWHLGGCTVETFPSCEQSPLQSAPRRYPRALLHEDMLTGEECGAFVAGIQEGRIEIAGIKLKSAQSPQWCSEFLPVKNEYMTRAGYVVSLRFGIASNVGNTGPLLIPSLPYYPDVREAARDWLPFTVHHGDRDDRYEKIVFLLPQTRAYIADVMPSDDRTLIVTIAGSMIGEQLFILKGAYWEDSSIHQLHAVVVEGKAQLEIPEEATRVEYFLIDAEGVTYDFHREDRFSHTGFGRRRTSSARKLSDQVRTACREAESVRTEFKPFVDPNDKLARNDQRTKFGQVVTTVVAFANCEGGCVFLGIDDDCTISGVEQELAAWAKAQINESVIRSYLGSLHNQLKARIDGEVSLEVSSVAVEDKLVVMIKVLRTEIPICVQGDTHLYVRTGPNNRKISPQEWIAIVRSGEFDRR